MRIEPATGSDLDRIADLWVDLAAEQREHGSHLLAAENRARIRAAAGRHVVDDGVLLAREGEETVGFVMFDVETGGYEQSVTRGVVRNVYVVPEERGRGVGSALFDAAEARLAEAGADVVGLEVMADNGDARRFYRERGYRPHRVVYERRLDGSPEGSVEGKPNDGNG